jgi:hypothetical protein
VSVKVSILLKHENRNNGGLCVVNRYHKGGGSINHAFLSISKRRMNLIRSGSTSGLTKFAVLDSRKLP